METVAFYPRFAATGDLSPLFQLFDDYDGHHSGGPNAGSSASRSQSSQKFSPRFDLREANDSYLLDGEIPGISQSDVEVEFADANILVVKGRSGRDYDTANSSEQVTSLKVHQVSVEDEVDKGESSVIASAKPSPKEMSKKSPPEFTYTLSEREVGQFRRKFTFPQKVDQDGVKASLKNGILSIVVPKADVRKITIE
ncbi:heat shock protein Hsp30-like [Elaphomyces granulatus]|jgi:HSP20 family molecular chaperone IbpA